MEVYQYKETKIKTYQWVVQYYREHTWKATHPDSEKTEEAEYEGGYASDSDLKKSDIEGDLRKRYSGTGELEADQLDSREGDDIANTDGKRRKSRSRGKDNQ